MSFNGDRYSLTGPELPGLTGLSIPLSSLQSHEVISGDGSDTIYKLIVGLGATTFGLKSSSRRIEGRDEWIRNFFLEADANATRIQLPINEEVLIGRIYQPELRGDHSISREHAACHVTVFNEITIRDLGSTAATIVGIALEDKASTIGFLH